jgi:hypothetical protein
MRPDRRVVSSLPLAELWDSAGPIAARRGPRVGDPDIRALFRGAEAVQFVVADADGTPPRWVPVAEARGFWMLEVRPRIVPADAVRFDYDAYPGRYCYVATAWTREAEASSPLVLLERYH